MAKKEAPNSLLKSLPVDPKILGGLVLIIIIAAVFMSRGGDKIEAPTDTDDAYVPPAPAVEDEPEAPVGQCTKNVDCNDNDDCTTDTCSASGCSYNSVPDCQSRKEQAPTITAANFGAYEDEFVQLDGKNYNIASWKVTNSKGTVFVQFEKNNYRLINGKITIYAGCGVDTTIAIYQCLDAGFFSDSGDKAILYDENETAVSEMAR